MDDIAFEGDGSVYWLSEGPLPGNGPLAGSGVRHRIKIGTLQHYPNAIYRAPVRGQRSLDRLELAGDGGLILAGNGTPIRFADLKEAMRVTGALGINSGSMSESERNEHINRTLNAAVGGALSAHADKVSQSWIARETVEPVTNRVAGVARVGLAAVEGVGAVASAPTVVGPVVLGTLAANEAWGGAHQIISGQWENGFIGAVAGAEVELAVGVLTPAGLAARARYLRSGSQLEQLGKLRAPAGFSSSPLAGRLPTEAMQLGLGQPLTLDKSRRYLYAVREDGRIVIAPEDLRREIGLDDTIPPLAKHNDLTENGNARMAGELNYRDGQWVVDQESGRYMWGSGRSASPDQLNQLVDVLRANLLNVTAAP